MQPDETEGYQAPTDVVDERVDGAGDPVDGSVDREPTYQGPDGYLTRDDLERLNNELTVADGWRANLEAKGDSSKAGMLIYLYAARRLGLTSPGTGLLDFMATIRQADFTAVLSQEAREGK